MRTYPAWITGTSIRFNERTGGPSGWTLCARFWSWRLEGRVAGKVLTRVIDTFFGAIYADPNHCWRSYVKRSETS